MCKIVNGKIVIYDIQKKGCFRQKCRVVQRRTSQVQTALCVSFTKKGKAFCSVCRQVYFMQLGRNEADNFSYLKTYFKETEARGL